MEHLYTNATVPYFRAPQIYLAFPRRFLPWRNFYPDAPSPGASDGVFMSSRDGRSFQRWPDPVIPITAPKDRDGNRSNYMAWGVVQLPGQKNELTVYAKEAYYAGPGSRLRAFRYRLDGFVSVHASEKGGELITKPLTFTGSKLVLNYLTKPEGSLRVEVQDAKGKPLEKLTLADCQELRGDSTAGAVSWKEAGTLARWAGKPVRLRFQLKDADLFSFRFQ